MITLYKTHVFEAYDDLLYYVRNMLVFFVSLFCDNVAMGGGYHAFGLAS